MRIELVAHLARPGAIELVRSSLAILDDLGHDCRVRVPAGVGAGPVPPDLTGRSSSLLEADGTPSDPDDPPGLVMSFGGDGTFLHAAHGARRTPLLGVNSDPWRSEAVFSAATLRLPGR